MELKVGQRWRWKYYNQFSDFGDILAQSDLILEIIELAPAECKLQIIQIIASVIDGDYIGRYFDFPKHVFIGEKNYSTWEYLLGQDKII